MEKIINVFEKIEESCLIFSFLCLLFLSIFQILLRNFFSTGIIYAESIMRYLVLWIGLLGASIATKEQKHISINIIPLLLSKKWSFIIKAIINMFSCTICILLSYIAIRFLKEEYKFANYLLFAEIILVFSFPLMAIRFLGDSIKNFISFLKNI